MDLWNKTPRLYRVNHSSDLFLGEHMREQLNTRSLSRSCFCDSIAFKEIKLFQRFLEFKNTNPNLIQLYSLFILVPESSNFGSVLFIGLSISEWKSVHLLFNYVLYKLNKEKKCSCLSHAGIWPAFGEP